MTNRTSHIRKRRSSGKLVVLNEEELIQQVHLRPILYDRTLKSYRKASLRQQYWQEVGDGMGATADECRRRWRSLRDAFAKHYKQIQRAEVEHVRNKHRKWVFYDQMSFMIPYIDSAIYELDDHLIEEFGDNSEEEEVHCEAALSANLPESQEEPQTTKLSSSIEDHHNEHVQQNTVSVQATDFMPMQEESVVMEHNLHHETHKISKENSVFSQEQSHPNSTAFSVQCGDSDEKFLLSCAPALRRFTARQNAYARLQIQQILFDIEFGTRQNN